jgi:hypothetical protein
MLARCGPIPDIDCAARETHGEPAGSRTLRTLRTVTNVYGPLPADRRIDNQEANE